MPFEFEGKDRGKDLPLLEYLVERLNPSTRERRFNWKAVVNCLTCARQVRSISRWRAFAKLVDVLQTLFSTKMRHGRR